MATISFSKTISNADQNRLLPALRLRYGLASDATAQDVLAAWQNEVGTQLRAIVREYERTTTAPPAEIALT
jgi:hypothetical protein